MYCLFFIIWFEFLGRFCRINNYSCMEYGRIFWYGYLGSFFEGDFYIIFVRVGEVFMGKVLYLYNCLLFMFCYLFKV